MSRQDGLTLVPGRRAAEAEEYHFSPAIAVAGSTIYISGQVGIDEDSIPLPTAEAQFVEAFDRIEEILAVQNLSCDDIVELSTFHTSFDDFDLFRSIKDRYIKGPVYPAWTAVRVASLILSDLLVEIRCTAVTPATSRVDHA